jgi:hypothetical protein
MVCGLAGDIRAFMATGVHEVIVDCPGASIAESIKDLQWFANGCNSLGGTVKTWPTEPIGALRAVGSGSSVPRRIGS